MTLTDQFKPTCLGAPIEQVRSLTVEERDAVARWFVARRRSSWPWGLAWAVLVAIPTGIPILIGGAFMFGTERIHSLLLFWAMLLPLACFIGWIGEVASPTRPWTRYLILGSLLSGGVGTIINIFSRGAGDLLIWPLVLAVFAGFALFFLRTLDRSKLVRPSKVRKDLRQGEVWTFAATHLPSFDLLPGSGLILRAGEVSFPSPLPAPLQMAAPIPESRWEIPAHFLHASRQDTQLFTRTMDAPEIEEGRALLGAHTRKMIPILAIVGFFAVASAIPLVIEASNSGFSEVPTGLRLFAAYWGVLFIWIAPRSLRLRSRLRSDLAAGRLVVVRPEGTPADGIPFAEVLPTSKIIWSYQGGIGPMRRKYAKTRTTRRKLAG